MAGKMSRDKGARGEREVIGMCQPIVDEVYTACGQTPPRLQRNSLQSDGGGCDIAGLDWIAIEVKWHEKPVVHKFWQQALEQAGATKVPVLIYRSNGVAWKVMLWGQIGNRYGTARRVAVTVRAVDFLEWFRAELASRI